MSAATSESAAKRSALSGKSWPVSVEVGVPRPPKKMRRVDHEKVETGGLRGDQRGLPAEEVGVAMRDGAALQLLKDGGVAGHQRAHLHAMGKKRRGKRAHDVGKAASLHQRKNLGSDREDLPSSRPPQLASRSIMF